MKLDASRPTHPQLVATVVFGVPCAYAVLCAIRGHLLLGRHRYVATGAPFSALALWGVAAALAAAWIGVTLRLGTAPVRTTRQRDAWAAVLILSGAVLLFLCGRLLGPVMAA